MTKYGEHFSTRSTPQSEPIPGKQMLPNSGGGYAFAVDDWMRLDRFLILGNEGGTYYASEKGLTIENAQCVLRCAASDSKRTVARIVEISVAGRAPKNDPAIFALAICAGQKIPEALDGISKVCRTGTMFFAFVEAVEKFRGHGRALNRALKNWYLDKEPKDLAYQIVKYQSRNGWSHRDILRLCKPKTEGVRDTIFGWAVGKPLKEDVVEVPELEHILAFEHAKVCEDKKEICRLIRAYNMPREAVPTKFLKEPEVWEALLEKMPMTAMIRNLATMTRVGLLTPMSGAVGKVLTELASVDRIRKSRLHPIAILSAMLTYKSGKSAFTGREHVQAHMARHPRRNPRKDLGLKSWSPVSQIVDALDGAFYKAFGNVESTNKRWLLALDVSGSMDGHTIAGVPGLSARVASAAMSLVTAATEPQHAFMAFTSNGGLQRKSMHAGYHPSGVTPLAFSPRQRIDDVCAETKRLTFGGTDCALPMLYALEAKIPVDVFVILTDNETWAGDIHPCQALVQYREKTGIGAKLITVGMASNGFTIADPKDGGMLDIVGMDTSVPMIMSDFAKA